MNARGRDAGFTLVELLVSLALLGMTSGLLLTGLVTGRRAWDRIEARARAGDRLMAAQARLAALLEAAVPQTSYAGSRPYATFEGGSARLHFLAPDGTGPGGVPLLYDLALDAGGLSALGRPMLAEGSTRLPARRMTVVAGADAVEFDYFGAVPPDHERRWRPMWEDQPTLPELIRVRLRLASGEAWPDLVVRPAAIVDTGCVFVASTGRCKGRA